MNLDLEELGINKSINVEDFILDTSSIPKIDISGYIKYETKEIRCKIIDENIEHISGGYGIIKYAIRYYNNIQIPCVIKESIDVSFNILNEAILQHLSYTTLKIHKLEYMIPKVYDIYYNTNVCFSMQRITGEFLHTFLVNSETSEKDFIYCFLQISIVLYILESKLLLDHRDLRVTNVFVVKDPKEIKFTIENKIYTYSCNYHICILDFGFACIGNKPSKINASEALFKKRDKCFKPGRDIFQLLISLLSLDSIKNKFSLEFYNKLASLLYDKKDYRNLLKSKEKADLSYIAINYDDFTFDSLLPSNFIKVLIHLLDTI